MHLTGISASATSVLPRQHHWHRLGKNVQTEHGKINRVLYRYLQAKGLQAELAGDFPIKEVPLTSISSQTMANLARFLPTSCGCCAAQTPAVPSFRVLPLGWVQPWEPWFPDHEVNAHRVPAPPQSPAARRKQELWVPSSKVFWKFTLKKRFLSIYSL